MSRVGTRRLSRYGLIDSAPRTAPTVLVPQLLAATEGPGDAVVALGREAVQVVRDVVHGAAALSGGAPVPGAHPHVARDQQALERAVPRHRAVLREHPGGPQRAVEPVVVGVVVSELLQNFED
jgi:hypothetical protein